MGTIIRPEISQKSRYWISKHRYYELKHFCLQYYEWAQARGAMDGFRVHDIQRLPGSDPGNPTQITGIKRAEFSKKMELVERAAHETDSVIGDYILEGVTRGKSYDAVNALHRIPCCKDIYYDLYRRFFYILSQMRD